jgi:hypothetical protein
VPDRFRYRFVTAEAHAGDHRHPEAADRGDDGLAEAVSGSNDPADASIGARNGGKSVVQVPPPVLKRLT